MSDSELEFYSTVPISNPVVSPSTEDVQMNGFAWSNQLGLLVAFGDTGGPIVDELHLLREPIDRVETYLQQDGD